MKQKILILLLLAAAGCGKGGQVPSLEAPAATAPITEGAALQNVLFEGPTEFSDNQPQPFQARILDLKNLLPPFDIAIESSNPNILAVTIVGSDSPTAIINPAAPNIIQFNDVIAPPFTIQFITTPSPVVERSSVDLTLSAIDRATRTVHFTTPPFPLSVVPAPEPIAAPEPAPEPEPIAEEPAPEPAPAPEPIAPTQRSATFIAPEDFPLKRNLFASTDFALVIQPAPPTADVGPVIWTVNSADALLTVNPLSDRFANVVSRNCILFTLQARTFDLADKQPRTPSVNVKTLCGPIHGLALSFEKERVNEAAGNITMVFSLPNGQLQTPSGQLTTNLAPPFTFFPNVARSEDTGVIFNLGITLHPPACPIGTCILKIQMTTDIAGIPNIKMTKAEEINAGFRTFTTTDAGNVRTIEIQIPNQAVQ